MSRTSEIFSFPGVICFALIQSFFPTGQAPIRSFFPTGQALHGVNVEFHGAGRFSQINADISENMGNDAF
ncbi:MAG: hypothetical protein H8E64_07090 [Candidatus Marinimicrobia bacterium]|nr:hypothetical protein [Candidatus Neomarinimicrobiota bacterium]